MIKLRKVIYFFLVLIISIPAFLSLLNNSYFSMHDDQHIARLFLLDRGISQGYIYPRWVDVLGFNYGYPLFNFYPPFVYYIAELFHSIGFSFIESIKATFITGFIVGAYGIYLLVKKFTNYVFGLLASVLYTYFFYHGVLIYVRGALSEFFALSILPYLILTLDNLKDKKSIKNIFLFSISLAILILTHPLIAFPTVIYIFLFLIFYLLHKNIRILEDGWRFVISGLVGLSISSFYWLPSMLERKYTLVNDILTTELASYKVHFLCADQFFNSNWGYGGSIPGCFDGMTFQIGKIHIILFIFSLIGFFIYLFSNIRKSKNIYLYLFFLFLTFFSLFMTTEFSKFIWQNISNLSYIQFPWRFMTFVTLFLSLTSTYGLFLFYLVIKKKKLIKNLMLIFILFIGISNIYFVGRYFYPQKFIKTNDKKLTSFNELAWRVSRSTFEFSPKGIKTTKSELNTTIPNIQMIDIARSSYEILEGKGVVFPIKNKFMEKEYKINSGDSLLFRQNTFYFPGWIAYLNNKEIKIDNSNDFKLITVRIPKGENRLKFVFTNTKIRTISTVLSLLSSSVVIIYFILLKLKKVKS